MFLTKNNKKIKLYKGLALGAAGLMCLGFTPVQALQLNANADYLGDDSANTIGSEVIRVDGAKDSVARGEEYTIQNAYFGNVSDKFVLGQKDSFYDNLISGGTEGYNGAVITDMTSSIAVYYSTDKVVNVTTEGVTGAYGKFTATDAGDYTIRYTMVVTYDNGEVKTYSTDINVESVASSAYMAFKKDAAVMPSIYDKALAKSGETYKDIELAIPTVYTDSESEEEIEISEVLLPSETPTTGNTVKITVSSTSNGTITLEEANGKVIMKGSEIAEKTANGDNITVKYSYYVGKEFVTSVEKKITVYDDYYSDEDGKSTYKLTTSRSADHTAITKVEKELPTVKAYASEDLKEEVDVKVEAVAYKKDASGNYTDKKVINDLKFTPWDDGDYKIVFTVTDFYGNKATNTMLVSGVVDSQKPEVIMYDASDVANNRAEGKFVSAETKLKSKTTINNVVIYAIGATDNVNTADEMDYKRTIKSSSRTIEIKSYNKYNLIFDYEFATLLSSNNVLSKQIKTAFETKDTEDKYYGKDIAKEADVKGWLKDNGFLLVTNTPKDGYEEADYIKEGLAYVDVSYPGNMLVGSLSGISYTLSYIATDKATDANTSKTLSYTISVTSDTSFADSEAPTITFNSSLKKYYGAKDIIKFSAPTISDNIDNYLEKSISYQYRDAEGNNIDDAFTFEDDKYEINIAEDIKTLSESPADLVITVTATDDNGNVATWNKTIKIIDVTDTEAPTIIRESYVTPATGSIQNATIELPKIVYADDNAGFITSDVRVYHIDSKGNRVEVATYGNNGSANTNTFVETYTLNAGSFIASYSGKYEAVVKIKDWSGNYVVTYYYYDVDSANVVTGSAVSSTLAKSTTLEAGEELELPVPTVSYSVGDGYTVYGVAEDDSKSATDYKVVLTSTSNPVEYKIENNETFVAYNLSPYTYSLAYKINLQIYKDGFDFVKTEKGVKLAVDLGGTTKDFYMNRLSNEDVNDGDYLLTSYGATGIDGFIYGVVDGTAITFYNLSSVSYVTVGTTKYYPEISEDNKLVFVSKGGNAQDYISTSVEGANLVLTGNGALAGETISPLSLSNTIDIVDTTNSNAPLTTNDFLVTTLTSDIYNVTVGDTKAPKLAVEYDYDTTAEKGETISIERIKATDESAYMSSGIDTSKSYVEISFSGRTSTGSETNSSSKFEMDKWTTYTSQYNSEKDTIDYKLSEYNNGTYTISYYVFDKAGNPSDGKAIATYKIAVGDVTSPTLKLGNDLIKETYKVGDTLTLNMSALTLGDNATTDENALMKSVEVKVTNTTTKDELENTEDGIVLNEKTNKYEGYFSYKINEVGTYKIEVTITDEAGWSTTQTVEVEVSETATDPNVVSTAVGIVLVVVAVLVLGGVVTYFVVSKVKLDKELKKGKNSK